MLYTTLIQKKLKGENSIKKHFERVWEDINIVHLLEDFPFPTHTPA